MIDHQKGTSFSFDYTRRRPWDWQQTVAQLDEGSRRLVVEGSGNRSRGIIGCSLQQTDAYDHKRHHAEKKCGTAVAGNTYHVWDFVLTRDNHSFVALHPIYGDTKMECKDYGPPTRRECRPRVRVERSCSRKEVDARKLLKGMGTGASALHGQGPAMPAEGTASQAWQ